MLKNITLSRPKAIDIHVGLSGEMMQALIAYSAEGNKFESQKEVPRETCPISYVT